MNATQPAESRMKRPAVDKQQAFIEFKQSSEGQEIEARIRSERDNMRHRKENIKKITETLNSAKLEIDNLKFRLDRKEDERKMRLREDLVRADDAFDDAPEEIIDEEELVMLKKMKDLKKNYRE